MKIDLHIHTRTGSDGAFTVAEVLAEAQRRGIGLISITDHDSVTGQREAIDQARLRGISCITGVELNVTLPYPGRKPVSLDFLGYRFDPEDRELNSALDRIREHREDRARQILEKINIEFGREGIDPLTEEDLREIQETVDGSFGRPHIANHLVAKGIVRDRQEAFDRYLVSCDVPKYPLSLKDASRLIRQAGGVLVLAHPNDPNGTSLASITTDLEEQFGIIREHMIGYIDGVECWHHRHYGETSSRYLNFAERNHLIVTGGSDCHQKPVIMGTVAVPPGVGYWFLR